MREAITEHSSAKKDKKQTGTWKVLKLPQVAQNRQEKQLINLFSKRPMVRGMSLEFKWFNDIGCPVQIDIIKNQKWDYFFGVVNSNLVYEHVVA